MVCANSRNRTKNSASAAWDAIGMFVCPSKDRSVLSTAAASSNSNPKDLAFPQLVHHCLPILWISHQKLRVNVTFNNGGEFSFSHGKVKRIIYFAFLPYLFLSSSDSHSRSCLLIACSGLTSAFSSVTLLLFRRHPGQGL